MGQHRTTTLELQLISAKDLRDLTLFTKMDVIAAVSIDDGTHNVTQTTLTPLVLQCGTNPTFNYTMRFTLHDSLLHNHLSSLSVQFVCNNGPLFHRRPVIAAFHVPLKALFDSADPKDMKFVTSCQVWRVEGTPGGGFRSCPKGEFRFSYKFGDKFIDNARAKEVQRVLSYPVQAVPFAQQQQNRAAAAVPLFQHRQLSTAKCVLLLVLFLFLIVGLAAVLNHFHIGYPKFY